MQMEMGMQKVMGIRMLVLDPGILVLRVSAVVFIVLVYSADGQ
jgi:hypothetical protein